MSKATVYIFAAGGTGGHIMPALAVAARLRELEPRAEVLFLGVGKPLEHALIEPHFPLEKVPFVPVLGGGLRGLLRMLYQLPAALKRVRRLYRERKPKAVIAFGGYPAFVPCLAAASLRIPRMLHEQNVKVGLANKVLGLLCQRIYAVKGARGFILKKVDGEIENPVRPAFKAIAPYLAPLPDAPLRILVLGGSQGAQSVNEAILAFARAQRELPLQIMHVAGTAHETSVRERYASHQLTGVEVFGFVSEPWRLLERADLVISRAGAMAAAELCQAARPVIYVPLAIAAAHQAENINAQLAVAAALAVEQGADFHEKLSAAILQLNRDRSKLNAMAEAMRRLRDASGQDAATILADALRRL